MATYLDDILHHHRARAAADDRDWRARLEVVRDPVPSMLAALSDSQNPNVKVIAEVKRRSPSKGWLNEGMDVVGTAREFVDGGAAAISVLTDAEHFAGSLGDLEAISQVVSVPLLRKDFTVSENDVLDGADAGASAVLLIVAALDDGQLESFIGVVHNVGLDAVVEVHDAAQANRAVDCGARIIGINQRDLHTFDIDRENAARVIAALPTSIVTVCESGLSSPDDVARAAAAGFDAVLVGESFVTAENVVDTVRRFSSLPLVSRE